jgi:hypothetical protein
MESKSVADTAVQSTAGSPPSSWIDRLVRWIDRFPGSTWLFYAIALGVSVLLNNAVLWIDGGLQAGVFDGGLSIFAFYTIYWIALYHYLTRHASWALKSFRPLLDVGDPDFRKIDFELATLPRNLGWLSVLTGIAIAMMETLSNLASSIGPVADQAQTVLPTAYFTTATVFFASCFFAFVFRTIRQLRLVSRLHEQATGIDLLSLHAPHAFSRLTARTGLGLILLLIIISLPAPWETSTVYSISAFDVVFYAGMALLAIIVFIIPLQGMRARLQQEKHRALDEVDELYRTASGRLYGNVRNDSYEDTGQTKDAMSALLMHRDRLNKISTWPWDPGTIRGFTSALLLPIFLILVAQLLERLF